MEMIIVITESQAVSESESESLDEIVSLSHPSCQRMKVKGCMQRGQNIDITSHDKIRQDNYSLRPPSTTSSSHTVTLYVCVSNIHMNRTASLYST